VVPEKVTLNKFHILLGLETISFSTYQCIFQVNVFLRDPLSLFTNFHNTLGVLLN
jgi:hypothetical protein